MTTTPQTVQITVIGDDALARDLETSPGNEHPGIAATATGPAALNPGDVDADYLFLDPQTTDESTRAVLEDIVETMPALPVIVLVDESGREMLETAIEAGATDSLPRRLCETRPDLVARRLDLLHYASPVTSQAANDASDSQEPSVSLVVATDGKVADVDTRLVEKLETDQETLVGQPINVIEQPTEGVDEPIVYSRHESLSDLVARVTRTGTEATGEVPLTAGKGPTRWFAVTVSPVDYGAREFVVVRGQDITDRRRLERTSRELFESVSDGLVVHEPDTGEIVAVNERFCEMNGYTREELVGETIGLLSADDPAYSDEQATEMITRAREDGPQVFEWCNKRASGETFPVEVHLQLAEFRGETRVIAGVQDITERKRREREFEQIFHGVHDPITVHDPETAELIDVNDSFCDLLGYDREEIFELGIEGYSSSEQDFTMKRAREFVQDVVDSDTPRETEWAVETRDGETRWLEVKGTTVEIGGELRYVSIDRDVTEQRRREREYEQIFENVNDAIAVFDPETGDILDVNQAYYDLVGYDSLDRIQELGIDGLSVAEEGYTAARGRELLREVDETDEPTTVEWRVDPKDGNQRWAEVTLAPAEIGGERRVLSIQRDVTERKRRQREYEQIYNGVQDGLQIMDPETLEILDVNDAYLQIFGHDSLEAIREEGVAGLSATDEGFTFERGKEIHQRVVETGDPEVVEWQAETTDGDVIWLELKVMPATIDGEQRTIVVHRDITERKERQRTLESFHDATAELTTADTVAGAARIAVEAAADVFDLPAAAVYHYEDDAGRLEPAATGPDLPSTDTVSPLTADDETAWAVFVEETMRRVDTSETAGFDACPNGDALLLPLGANGVLAVWSFEETFDTDAASILAATLEAALNRLRGERRLESRREELEAHAERAERLESITELTRRVEAAITTESSRQGIQEAVCAELVDVEPFTAAWVSEAVVGTDRLTPRSVSGISADEVEQVTVTDSDVGSDPNPAAAVWQSGDPFVTNDLVGGGPRSEWRRRLLRGGSGSVCAVPLSYGGVTHGVLTVAAAEPESFGDQAVEMLAQLGESIGYAITAIERQRALESDDTLELEFEGTSTDLSFAVLARRCDCRVQHERTVRRQDGTVSVYYTLLGDLPASLEEQASEVFPGDVSIVSQQKGEAVLERRGSSWFGSFISEYGGVLRRGRATDGKVELVVELPQEANTRTMVTQVRDRLGGLELTAQRHHRETETTPQVFQDRLEQRLSDRQYEALETAHAMGYFEWPRDSSGEAVADTLDITQPTVNKHIRLGERKVFDLIFETDTETPS